MSNMEEQEMRDLFDNDSVEYRGELGYIQGYCKTRPTEEQAKQYVEWMYEVEVEDSQIGLEENESGWYWICDILIQENE